jgi:glycogen synthase
VVVKSGALEPSTHDGRASRSSSTKELDRRALKRRKHRADRLFRNPAVCYRPHGCRVHPGPVGLHACNMRMAFLTPEFPSESRHGGGLATYLHRMAMLLQRFGHEPEVFVWTQGRSEDTSYNGVPLHRVNSGRDDFWWKVCGAASKRATRSLAWSRFIDTMIRAKSLACALERRHTESPFHLVQSADYQATGLFVRPDPQRVHMIRCSWAADLCKEIDQNSSAIPFWQVRLERLAMRRADLTYAPSHFIADHFKRVHKIPVWVLRPPNYQEVAELKKPSFELPSRFLLHFGQLMKRKGTAILAEALPFVWKSVPELNMVWIGPHWDAAEMLRWRRLWGVRADQVVITGALSKDEVYAVLQRADATVLPSQVDNLPNTVIESLMFGIPVLGSRGASVDELVEEGVSGHLVEVGNVKALADLLIRHWLNKTQVTKGFIWRSKTSYEMEPEHAVAKFLALYAKAASKKRDAIFPSGSAETRCQG